MCNPAKAISSAFGQNDKTQETVQLQAQALAQQQAAQATAQQQAAAQAAAQQQAAAAAAAAAASKPAPAAPAIDYAGLASGYTNFARPQIDSQYSKAQDALSTGLAEKGLGGSSIAKTYGSQLQGAYDKQISGLPGAADTYAHSGASGFTPMGDLFSSLIKPVASFNANNRFVAPDGTVAGTGASSGTSNINLAGGGGAPGSTARVVN